MKILLATSSFSGGGITSYAHEVISSYSQNNEMSVLVGDDSKSPIKNSKVKVYYYDCQNTSLTNALNIYKLINNEIKPNLIISSNTSIIPLIAPYLSNNIKIITISHSLKYIEADIAVFNNEYIDNIIALSHYNKKYLESKVPNNQIDKIRVIYNFVKEHPQAKTIREKKKNNKTLNIVFPGGGASSKSPDIVCKIIQRLIQTNLDFKFYWLGHASPPLKRLQKIKSVSNIFPNDHRIIFTGRLVREEAEKIISQANILLSPSRREGCPIALLEAMRIGCIPIVADYKNANAEIISHKKNGLVIKHDDIKQFVDTIIEILNQHHKFHYLYDSSHDTFSSYLTYESWKLNMDHIINEKKNYKNKRFRNFNRIKYKYNLIKLSLLKYYDLFVIVLFEYIPAAFSIYMQSLQKKD